MREARSNTESQRGMTRREMLQALVALAAGSGAPIALAQDALPAAQFTALAQSLVGYAFVDHRAARSMLAALSAAVGPANLTRLARLASSTAGTELGPALKAAKLEATAETVVAALYSGTVNTPRGPRVIAYDQALVWQALPWTKPNAFCGGETNYWASAPSVTS